ISGLRTCALGNALIGCGAVLFASAMVQMLIVAWRYATPDQMASELSMFAGSGVCFLGATLMVLGCLIGRGASPVVDVRRRLTASALRGLVAGLLAGACFAAPNGPIQLGGLELPSLQAWALFLAACSWAAAQISFASALRAMAGSFPPGSIGMYANAIIGL